MLRQLCDHTHDNWTTELADWAAGRPSLIARHSRSAGLASSAPAVRGIPTPVLTPRERAVLDELARGASYADIAQRLVVSENTVKTHISSLYAKLSAKRRSDALAVARDLNLL